MSIYKLVTIFLLSLYFLDFSQLGIEKIFWQALPTAILAVFLGVLFIFFKQKKIIMPWQSLITGLIIGLVAQFGERWFILAGITCLALALKFFIRIGGRPIFNPAALGLFLGAFLFSSHPAWWGGSFHPWIFLVWIPVVIYKLKRWAPMLAFIIPLVIFNNFSVVTSGSIWFFASIMLIEPMTSPVKIKTGFLYGGVVALVYLTLGNLLLGLLLGNLTKVILEKYYKL